MNTIRHLAPALTALTLILTPAMLPAVEIIAHRGASHDAPENTVAAARLGFAQQADAVEVDVWLTKDGRAAILHDATTKRTTGVEGKVAEMTLAQLQQLDAGSWKDKKFAGEKIPTLDDILAARAAGKKIVIEVKDDTDLTPELVASLQRTRTTPQDALIICFQYDTLKQIKSQLPQYTCLWLAGYKPDKTTGRVTPDLPTLIRQAKAAGFEGLNLNYQWPIDAAFVNQVHAAGLKLYVWTVNDAAVARRLVAAGVDGITTDRPQWLREQLKP